MALSIIYEFRFQKSPSHRTITLAFCRCSCGNDTVSYSSGVKSGKTKSCGCLRISNIVNFNTTHGMSKTHEAKCWVLMRRRCSNKRDIGYPLYGGRGITVCDSWKYSFKNFITDMGRAPSSSHSIDRIDSNKGYCKENCRWATPKEQANNTSRNKFIVYKERRLTLAQWCEELSLPYSTINARLTAYKWSVDEAFNTPIRPCRR